MASMHPTHYPISWFLMGHFHKEKVKIDRQKMQLKEKRAKQTSNRKEKESYLSVKEHLICFLLTLVELKAITLVVDRPVTF